MPTPDPRLVAAIRRQPSYLQVPLLTTALIESGGRLDAVGDSGRSHGPFQMYDLGRGAGVPIARRRDPVFSAQAAAREFQTFYNRGARGADLAYRAQRPADRGGYVSRYQQLESVARRILGQSDGGVPAPAPGNAPAGRRPGGAQDGGGGELTPGSRAAVLRYAQESERDVVEGRMPADPMGIAAQLRFTRNVPDPAAPGAPGLPQGRNAPAPSTGPGGLAPILPGQPQYGSFGYSDPEGQDGRHMAVDWFANAGATVRSPVTGRVVRVSLNPNARRTASGQVFGGVLGIRDASGRLFVMRHLDPQNFRVGQEVRAGMPVGRVTDWSGDDHVHLEAYRPGSSDREYSAARALNIAQLYRKYFGSR